MDGSGFQDPDLPVEDWICNRNAKLKIKIITIYSIRYQFAVAPRTFKIRYFCVIINIMYYNIVVMSSKCLGQASSAGRERIRRLRTGEFDRWRRVLWVKRPQGLNPHSRFEKERPGKGRPDPAVIRENRFMIWSLEGGGQDEAAVQKIIFVAQAGPLDPVLGVIRQGHRVVEHRLDRKILPEGNSQSH